MILLFAFSLIWHYIRLQRISGRKIISDFALPQIRFPLKWTQFILPTIFMGIGLYGKASLFILSGSVSIFVYIIVEWQLTQKYKYDAFVISGDNLISNDFKLKTFNLQELTMVDFLPFSDSLQLKFQDGRSISIHRSDFDKGLLSSFFNAAIGKSKLHVLISDDAQSKIQVL